MVIIDYVKSMNIHELGFDVIHAHDWLVCDAARYLKHYINIPLVVTIHATEHGRNHGLHNDLQHAIHYKEWQLTYEARSVIGCSSYMEREIKELFQVPSEKIVTISNGVDPSKVYRSYDLKKIAEQTRDVYVKSRIVQEQQQITK
ncbi:MAG: glycosyltransferase family 4 protein, partial [Bacilli bacterium]